MKLVFLLALLLPVCAVSTAQNCNNWLYTPSQPSFAEFGQINITGNKITVEATFNRTTPYTGGLLYAGDLVSKHNTPSDANYLLRPNDAEITTSNGYFRTPDICEIELNKTYHVAMVYDGATLKFYRNGFLMSQVAATGNLFQNNWQTQVGFYDPAVINTNFIGYINEVRIWNTVKTQAEIRANMNNSLPNPTTQPGLVAYYTFDNLINKQGNASFNGVLSSTAAINKTNPNCIITPDSCSTIVTPPNTETIINTYTPLIAFNPCSNKITVEDASTFKVGDTVLLIQMKGAIIDSSNTASFGSIVDYRNAGNYEFNYIKTVNGNVIELKNLVTREYDIQNGKVQLISIPYYEDFVVNTKLTCLPWDGQKGGVLAFIVKDELTLNADLDVTGKGLNGGLINNPKTNNYYCHENQYYYSNDPIKAAQKGEGITSISTGKSFGMGSLANGGGGGSEHNAGGGGGSNAASGGKGGNEWITCSPPSSNGGIGGNQLSYSNVLNKIFLGGGGGAGHCDNLPGFNPNGGNGGGIIIIQANSIKANAHSILANGAPAVECTRDGEAFKCHEGMGGGGGGGAVLVKNNSYTDKLNIEIKGGKGADMNGELAGKLGPGGGGSGGVSWFSGNSLSPQLTISNQGGNNGINIDFGADKFGATAGQQGRTVLDLIIQTDTTLFKPNIDSLKIKDSITSCQGFDFKGLAFTRNFPITKWNWSFGDNSFANTQNAAHTYLNLGTYPVKLIVTDINGCVDSVVRNVSVTTKLNFDFNYKQDICNPLSVQFFNIGAIPGPSYWSFGDGNSITGNLTPTNLYASTGNFIVKYSIQNGSCSDTITKTVSVNIAPANTILTPDTTICFNSTKQLRTIPALNFCWSPTTFLDDPNSPNPTTSTTQPITYYFTAELPGTNLIKNGDFTSGNTDFTSQYIHATPNITEAQYFVGANPQAWNPSLANCTDHTTGTGNMMLVNGAPIADVNVWTQTVTVTPNTNYAFSTWIQALFPPNPAQLSFSINGASLGTLITASLPTCTWKQFYTTWNSGTNTTATIAIVNKNTFVQGNDFALDDISFSPVLIKRDSVKISIETPVLKSIPDTTGCAGAPVQLTTTGASSYSWSPAAGLSNSSIASPAATVTTATQYIVTGVTLNGCIAKDTVNISVKPAPPVTISTDTSICRNLSVQLFASGGNSYAWSPAATLENPTTATPVASPLASTSYRVTITGTNGCTNTDSIMVAVKPVPQFTISPNQATCASGTAMLTAGGGTTYLWSPANLVSNSTSSNPTALAPTTTTYSVLIKDNACNDSATLSTTVRIAFPPVITVTKTNDIDCAISTTQLSASGANTYVWTPANGLNNSKIANPVASLTAAQDYIVTGTDTSTKCSATASISILVKPPFGPSPFIPNAFTPNGDGLNDCFSVKHFGTIKSVNISIFNRFGSRVFHSQQVNDCWDGTYKGTAAEAGNYVYIIKTFNDCGETSQKGNLVLVR